VEETNRIVQVGTQQRSMAHFIEAKQRFIDSGLIGQVHMVRTVWNANSGYLSPVPAGMETKPQGLDWEACLGSLPKIPWDPKRYFNRFAYFDFSTGGQTGGLFVHWVDVVHWYLGLHKSKSAVALGGIFQHKDGRDTADNINAIVDYDEGLNVSFEATISDMIPKQAADIVFMGTGGRLSIVRGGYRFIPAAKGGEEITSPGSPEEAHMANWLDCVRTRKPPNCDVVEGHYSATACHLLNLATNADRVTGAGGKYEAAFAALIVTTPLAAHRAAPAATGATITTGARPRRFSRRSFSTPAASTFASTRSRPATRTRPWRPTTCWCWTIAARAGARRPRKPSSGLSPRARAWWSFTRPVTRSATPPSSAIT
jgi:hypothetical protein